MYIHTIAGCMWSGKTERLCYHIKRHALSGRRVRTFVPAKDTRRVRSLEEMQPNIREVLKPVKIESPLEIIKNVEEEDRVIALDEIQFWSPAGDSEEERKTLRELEEVVEKMRSDKTFAGKIMLASGLDRDFRDQPFESTTYLLSVADDCEKPRAICMKCRDPNQTATCTQRLIDGKPAPANSPRFLIGDQDSYEPRCRGCYQRPK